MGTGDTISFISNYQQYPVITTDGNGGAYIAWMDARWAPDGYVYAQKLVRPGLYPGMSKVIRFPLAMPVEK